jgi:predicted dienelactone hydrolase
MTTALWVAEAQSAEVSAAQVAAKATHAVQVTEIDLYDHHRQRPVKITVWFPAQAGCAAAKICLAEHTKRHQAVVFSHGAMGAAKGYSWIGKLFAAEGYVTVGVNHYGESWVYGPEHVNPAAALQFWERPLDISFVLDQLQRNQLTKTAGTPADATVATDLANAAETQAPTAIFNQTIAWDQMIAVGHSSGGATVFTMAGSKLAFADAATYCTTAAAAMDRSCHYLKFQTEANTKGYNPAQNFFDARIKSVIALDPALGHATTQQSLSDMRIPVLVIGSQQNDFLPYDRHAGYYAATIPNAQSLLFDQGEGHFVYLDPCKHAYQAMGVAICTDRPGVDRREVHKKAATVMLKFVMGQ